MRAAEPFTLLMVAKAPEPGRVKTRLCPPLTPLQAAELASAALLDSLAAAVEAVEGARQRIVIAWQGELSAAVAAGETRQALDGCLMIPQRGGSFAERLVNAHADVADLHPGSSVVQIGMDTPQISPAHLVTAAQQLRGSEDSAVLGLATDGGWWLLGLSRPSSAAAFARVPMSTASTGRRTRASLESRGCTVTLTDSMRDVDTWADAVDVAAQCPASRFAQAVLRVNA